MRHGSIECQLVAGVAELADATDSKSVSRKGVWVRVPPSVLRKVLGAIERVDLVTEDPVLSRPAGHGVLHMGYVLGMYMVIFSIAIGLGVIVAIFGEKAPKRDH